jgi:hypothetical protein
LTLPLGGAILSTMANETVFATYRVRIAEEVPFVELLATHWDTLRRLELVTDAPSVVYRSVDEPPTYVEIFTWVEGGFTRAHDHPDVLTVWEAIGQLLEPRAPHPMWEFPHFLPVRIGA